jgi:hypothetical protein
VRNPVRSEADAFHWVFGGAAVIGGSVLLGALAGPIAGVALFAGALIGAFIWEVATKDPERRRPLREAASAAPPPPPTGGPRVLVVANRTLEGDELRAELARRARAGARLRVVAPILVSRTHYIASDVDKELEEAGERLGAVLSWARDAGIEVAGSVGDPNVALGAIEDALRTYGADEVLISTHPPSRSNWLETGIVERLRDELEIPVTHMVVDLEAERGAGAAR